jgi:parvulin-like peptidyl-prolyl isomerase
MITVIFEFTPVEGRFPEYMKMVDTLREDLAKVAFSLKPGDLSGVLELPEGCYIMKVEEYHPAHTKPLNEVRGEIERTLEAAQRQRLRKQWVERLKGKAFIRLFQAT